MKATLYLNNAPSQWASDALDVQRIIARFFTRARRGESVRLEVN